MYFAFLSLHILSSYFSDCCSDVLTGYFASKLWSFNVVYLMRLVLSVIYFGDLNTAQSKSKPGIMRYFES